MRILLSGLLAAALFASAAPALADTTKFTLDPGHTQVRFSWDHFGFSVPEANFTDISGTLTADLDNPTDARVEVTIQVASIDTHVPLLDEHLLTKPEFFKVDEHPTITFTSTDIRNVADDRESFELVGDLTINGITKEVILATTVNKVGEHPMYDSAPLAAGFNATTTVKRSDFGMGAYAPAVSDELDVRITVEAVEAEAFAKAQQG